MAVARTGLGLAALVARSCVPKSFGTCRATSVPCVVGTFKYGRTRFEGRCVSTSHIGPLFEGRLARSNDRGAQSRHTPLPRTLAPSRLPLGSLQARFASSSQVPAQDSLSRTSEGAQSHAELPSNGSASRNDQHDASISSPLVAYHLFFCAALVYLIIVVGGLTRLTESGLSITEWNPGFKGMKLPITDQEWDEEWEKYKKTPEWAVLNRHMTVDDFKKIYMWEWSHRILGRFIGMAFALPAFYFLARGRIARGSRWKIWAIALGIGFQGALGWFMVRSGLAAPEATPPVLAPSHPNATAATGPQSPRLDGQVTMDGQASTVADWHPRVSHFRLAAHLGTAFAVYLGMLHTGMVILREHKIAARKGRVSGLFMGANATLERLVAVLQTPGVGRFRGTSRAMLALAFLTAMSGALVAGLDAGLVYSEFPYMGDGLVPPRDELLDERYSWGGADSVGEASKGREPSPKNLVFGNMSQNPVTVQLMHRCLAITTLCSALALGVYGRRLSKKIPPLAPPSTQMTPVQRTAKASAMPPAIPRLATGVAGMACVQATLGITTLIYLVPIELASAHQAGSVALLSFIIALLVSLRQPSTAARLLASRSNIPGSQLGLTTQRQQEVAERALKRVVQMRKH